MRSKYTELKDKLKHGVWIFTCSMKPLQFDKYDVKDESEKYEYEYDYVNNPIEWENFKYDDFYTIEGSYHSIYNCSCKVISEKYAKWFLKNKIYELFEVFQEKDRDKCWELYEQAIREKCKIDNIEYEGF